MDEPKERQKILLIGDGPSTARLHAALLAMDFADVERRVLADLVLHGRGFSRFILDDHLMPVKEHVLPYSVYDWKQEPADSLQRRKEPKGPRGKWGKL